MSLQGRTKTFKHKLMVLISSTITLFILSGCQENFEAKKSSVRNASSSSNINGDVKVYEANPVVLVGSTNLTSPGWENLLTWASVTDESYLSTKCQFKQENYVSTVETTLPCIEVYKDNKTPQIGKNTDGSWNYEVDSDEFYQVNTFYHINKIVERFHTTMEFVHKYTHQQSSMYIPPATKHNIAATQAFWFGKNGTAKPFKFYSQCEFEGLEINAYFNPAQDIVCMGWNANQPKLYMAADPSVIYHEAGHAFVKIMMNQRNTIDNGALIDNYQSLDYKSDLGVHSYDEAGAINEGISDYFSYYVNGRRYMGEWGADLIPVRIFESQGYVGAKFGRPMDEDDPYHDDGISGDVPGEKLSYPQYLNYDTHSPEARFESEVHMAGKIVSHYLARLTENFKSSCSYSTGTLAELKAKVSKDQEHYAASSMIVLLLSETLAEIGDLTAKGSDYFNEYAMGGSLSNVFFTNLNPDEAYLWSHFVTPPNMRRFFKLFAKNIKYYISDPMNGLCPEFSVDASEALLDEYGLLLFKSYGDAGQGMYIDSNGDGTPVNYEDYDMNYLLSATPFVASSNSSEVNELNRKQTILVSKDYLDLPNDGTSQAYIFDGRSEIENMLANITFEGSNPTTSTDLADVKYNNNNIRISPGEIVGVALNLVNNSNSTMAGVQVLANDWDHMKLKDDSKTYVNRQENTTHGTYGNQIATWEPCQIDNWPKDTEGGVVWDPDAVQSSGDCGYTTRTNKQINVSVTEPTNPYYEKDSPQPICMVQFSDENETRWVSQDYFRKYVLGLDDHECLNNESSGAEFNPNECLIRVIPAASSAIYGRIEPQKTWLETISQNGNTAPKHAGGNITLMEVSKWIQPGTVFNCRFRARFTNCVDCYNNNNSGEDYADYEYAGMEPFKVINFAFSVVQ